MLWPSFALAISFTDCPNADTYLENTRLLTSNADTRHLKVSHGSSTTIMAHDELLKPTLHVEVLLKSPLAESRDSHEVSSHYTTRVVAELH